MASQSQPIKRLHRFEPGHLLTENDLNLFVDAIEDLDRRLAALEAACRSSAPAKDKGGYADPAVRKRG